jgi:hypothetical protein
MTLVDTSTEDKIDVILKRIQKTYLVLLCLVGLFTLPLLTSIIDGSPIPNEELESLLQFITYLMIYLGLRNRKSWVVPLILLTSAFSSFLFFLHFLTPATELKLLMTKAIAALLCLFFIYQMIIFSRKEVRSLFGVSKQIIFGG